MLVASIDVGTSKIKGALIKLEENIGAVKFIETVEIDQQVISSSPEVNEHNPYYIVNTSKSILKHFSVNHGSPDIVVFSSYLFTLTLANDRGEYVSNTITWLDERSTKVMDVLKPLGKDLYSRTGIPPIYIFSLPKILYLKKFLPSVLSQAKLFLDSKSVITTHFLGHPVTDFSTASGTYQMLNIFTLKWDDLALEIAGLDENNLPELAEGDYVEEIRSSIALEIGLEKRTPLVLGFYDGGSMIYAFTRATEDIAVVNLGTSAMLRVVHKAPLIDDLEKMRFNTYYLYKKTWIPGGSTNNAGVVLEVIAKLLGLNPGKAFEIMAKLGVDELISRERPLVLPLLYPERIPSIGKDLGLSIVGLKISNIDPRDILLSSLESIIVLLSIFSSALEEKGVRIKEVRVGGGVTSIPLTCTILAGVLEKPVAKLDIPHVVHIGNTSIAVEAVDPRLGVLIKDYIEENVLKNLVQPQDKVVELYRKVKPIYMRYLELLYSNP